MTFAHIGQTIRMQYANAPNHSSQWGQARRDAIDGSLGETGRAAVTEEMTRRRHLV
jgi:hypothetical protein